MLRLLLGVGLVAGLTAGLFLTALQEARLTPLILEAERYESAPHTAHSAAGSENADMANAGAEEWAPEEGLERTAYTLLANLIVSTGFALLLVACFALSQRPVDAPRGALWGLAGFAVFALAPAYGLPPELPGSLAADLGGRQLWWLGAAAGTAAGLAMLVFLRAPALRALGALPIAIPHIIGAPHPEHFGGVAPPELAAEFAAVSLATAALFWVALGALAGFAYAKISLARAGHPGQ